MMKRRTGDRPPFRVDDRLFASMNPMKARRGALLLIVAALLLGACRVETTVGVELHRDGSGRVRVHVAFDEDARQRVPVSSIKVDDLRAAGWQVTTDATSITLEKPFARPQDLSPTVHELTGSGGLVGVASAARTRGFSRTKYTVHVDLDLRPLAVGVLDDRDLANRLRLVGLDPTVLELKLDAPLRQAVDVRLLLALPDGRVKTWSVAPGGHVEARATSSVPNPGRLAWLFAAIALGGAAVLLLVTSLFLPGRRRRRGRDEPEPEGPAGVGPPDATVPEQGAPGDGSEAPEPVPSSPIAPDGDDTRPVAPEAATAADEASP